MFPLKVQKMHCHYSDYQRYFHADFLPFLQLDFKALASTSSAPLLLSTQFAWMILSRLTVIQTQISGEWGPLFQRVLQVDY